MELRNGVSTCKIAALVDMSQSSLAHMRKDVGSDIERQRGGRLQFLANQEKRQCITLVLKAGLELQQQNNFNLKHVNCYLISL